MALTFCPLENALKKVDKDLDEIPKLLKEENKSKDGRQKVDMSTHVHDNNKYVPIEESQRKVIEAIEDGDGPLLIVLHGGHLVCTRFGTSFDHSD